MIFLPLEYYSNQPSIWDPEQFCNEGSFNEAQLWYSFWVGCKTSLILIQLLAVFNLRIMIIKEA